MTYARSRLLLGMSSVGTFVVVAVILLTSNWNSRIPGASAFLNEGSNFVETFSGVGMIVGLLFLLMLPFDFLGGFWLPKRFDRSNQKLTSWTWSYLFSTATQFLVYVLLGTTMIAAYRMIGLVGPLTVMAIATAMTFMIRNYRFSGGVEASESERETIELVNAKLREWNIPTRKLVIVNREDPGFTGGIIGLGSNSRIVIPKQWLRFRPDELAVVIGRRSMAIATRSYQKGIFAAVVWNAACFITSIWLAGSLASVTGLVMTMCWFTLFAFGGILFLPSLSRNGSLSVDRCLIANGVSMDLLEKSSRTLDDLQDSEPVRSPLIESIFHPIPSVANRANGEEATGIGAWQIARTSLALSWACIGLLPRAVHCNVGRPDLWLLLPSD